MIFICFLRKSHQCQDNSSLLFAVSFPYLYFRPIRRLVLPRLFITLDPRSRRTFTNLFACEFVLFWHSSHVIETNRPLVLDFGTTRDVLANVVALVTASQQAHGISQQTAVHCLLKPTGTYSRAWENLLLLFKLHPQNLPMENMNWNKSWSCLFLFLLQFTVTNPRLTKPIIFKFTRTTTRTNYQFSWQEQLAYPWNPTYVSFFCKYLSKYTAYAPNCYAEGPGLTNALTFTPALFTVFTCDENGAWINCGGAFLRCTLLDKKKSVAKVSIKDNLDGIHTFW